MSGSLLASVLVPVVVAIALACWIYAIYHADRHRDPGQGKMPSRPVIGGAFRATGGRQVTPRWGEPAGPSADEGPGTAAVGSEDQEPGGARAAREADLQARRDAGRPAGL